MINILKNIDIENGDIVVTVAGVDDIVDNRGEGNNNYKELSTFIQDIYINCKKLNIQSAIIHSGINLPEFILYTNSLQKKVPIILLTILKLTRLSYII